MDSIINKIRFKDGQPCPHNGCLNHKTHPCELCGRIQGKGEAYVSVDKCTSEKNKSLKPKLDK